MKDHMQASHFTKLEIRPYVCEYCDAGFTNPEKLKQHLSSHDQVRKLSYLIRRSNFTLFSTTQDSKRHTTLNESEVTTSSDDEELRRKRLDDDNDSFLQTGN